MPTKLSMLDEQKNRPDPGLMKSILLTRVGASDIRKEGRRRSKRETLLRRDAKQTFAPKALAERLKI